MEQEVKGIEMLPHRAEKRRQEREKFSVMKQEWFKASRTENRTRQLT